MRVLRFVYLMSIIIGICGSGEIQRTQNNNIYEHALCIGKEIAKKNGILICGGKGGIMEAACKGAKQENGITIGILPYNKTEQNKYIDVPIVTGIGEKRNAIIIQSADCVIFLAGRWGTLNEITLAAIYKKPVVFLKHSGGVVDSFINSSFLQDFPSPYAIVDDENEAVQQAFKLGSTSHPKH